ncbi:MAG: response regulator [Acidobacteria bacterium]|nr:response regulator [Acidobacteriota bacterium]
MPKLLVVDDDDAVRRFMRASLSHQHEIVDTAIPDEALALVLEHKPDAILLDLRMPRYSGYELCQTLSSLSATQLIPVIIVSGEAGEKTKQLCKELGAVAYFEKPLEVDQLLSFLDLTLKKRRVERRSEVRVRLNVALAISLETSSEAPAPEEVLTTTENLALNSFLCSVSTHFDIGATVPVRTVGPGGELVGTAKVIRAERRQFPLIRYAFRFVTKSGAWVLH